MNKIENIPYYELLVPNFEDVCLELDYIINSQSANLATDVSYITPNYLFENAPHLQRMLNELGLRPHFKLRYLTVIVNPGDQLHPHVDSTEHPWNLLLPIKNTENTVLSFYDCDTGPVLIDRINERGEHVPYYAFEQHNCKEAYSLSLTKPTLINSHEIHGVVNNSNDKQRQSVSIHICGEFHPTQLPERFLKNV